jgi:hypothetical protein
LTGAFAYIGSPGATGPTGPKGTLRLQTSVAVYTAGTGATGLSVGNTVTAVIPLTQYTFQVNEFPLLQGVAYGIDALGALNGVYVTHPTPTTWNAVITSRIIDTSVGDVLTYTVYYIVARNS